jgi:hypothetical protein
MTTTILRPVRGWMPTSVRRWLGARRRRGRPIVIYTPGKAGSTTLHEAIAQAIKDRPVHKIHSLDAELVDRLAADHDRPPTHVESSRTLMRRMPTASAPWDVICTIRDPLSHAVSSFFQNAGARRQDISTPERALASFLADRARLALHLRWFERELQEHLDIDVYTQPFDRETCSVRVDAPHARVLVLRIEDLDRWEPTVSEFLDAEIRISHALNVAEAKEYAEVYRRFREEMSLPADLVDEALGSRLAKHFYSPAELGAVRQRWCIGVTS